MSGGSIFEEISFKVEILEAETPYYILEENTSPYFVYGILESFIILKDENIHTIALGPVADAEGHDIEFDFDNNGNSFITLNATSIDNVQLKVDTHADVGNYSV